MEDSISTMFFYEFPDRYKETEIFDLFGNHGILKEVVISPKRNKQGKRFGFARFKDVEDIRVLIVKLDNIFIDNIKIHACVPRFDRYKGEFKGGGSGNQAREGHLNMKEEHSRKFDITNDNIGVRSFTKVVSYRSNHPETIPRKLDIHLKFQSK